MGRALLAVGAAVGLILCLVVSRSAWEPSLLSHFSDAWVASLARSMPDDPAVQRERGVRAADALRLEEAEQALAAATELNPLDAATWARYGAVLGALGKMNEAGRALSRATTLSPEDPDVQALQARVVAQQEGPTAALALLERLLTRHPDSAEGWYVQGVAYSSIHNTQRAADALERARELSPRRAAYSRELAQIRHEVGALAEAESLARHAIRQAPVDPTAALVLARILLDRNPSSGARVEIRALLARASESGVVRASALREMGRLALLDGDPRAAIPLLQEAHGLAPQEAKTLYYLAGAYRDVHDPRAASTLSRFRTLENRQREETFLRAAVKEQVAAWPPRQRLIEFYVRHGDRDQAGDVLQDYLQRVPTDARALALGRKLGLAGR